jgi:hypothetical protein
VLVTVGPKWLKILHEGKSAAIDVNHFTERAGVIARAQSRKGLAEEQPNAYKNVDRRARGLAPPPPSLPRRSA